MTERQVDPTRTRASSRRIQLRILRLILFILVLASSAGGSFTPARAKATRALDPQSSRPRLQVTNTSGPVLVQPADGAALTGASAALEVQAGDPDGGTFSVSFYGRRWYDTAAPGADFTLAALPDTQNYVTNETRAQIFTQQTEWIAANQTAENIVFVTHLGDIVDHGNSATEYQRAGASMDVLDAAGVPYSVGPGNRDQTSVSLYEDYFGVSRFAGKPWYGGHYGSDNYNNYSLFSASGNDFILINLQFDPEPAHLDWADALLKAHPERRGILVSHSILNYNDNWSNQGIFTALKDNPNLFLMLCGHRHSASDGAAYRAEPGEDGHTIHVMLADYQQFPDGGSGYLRLLRFSPADSKIYATTYSPFLDAQLTTYPDQMEMEYDMDWQSDWPFELLGRVENVAGGGTAAVTWGGLSPGAAYEWYAVVEGEGGPTQGPTWSFTTEPPANQPPVLSPTGAQSVDEGSELAFTASAADPDLPAQKLAFSLVGAPAGAAVDPDTGAFTWTPGEDQGPNEYSFTVRVCDDGSPALCDEQELAVSVAEVNRAPVLAEIPAQNATEGAPLTFTASATDADLPANVLTFSLEGAPEGAEIHPQTGTFFWTPTEGQGLGEYTFSVKVCDGGSPALCDEEELTVRVARNSAGGAPPRTIFLPFLTTRE